MGTPRTTLRPNTLTDTNTTPTMRRRATLAAAQYLRTDATEVLMKDHQKVQGMLRTVISSAADNKVRKENMNQVVFELSQHSAVEEQILYPTLRHLHDDGDKMADRAIEEHLKVERAGRTGQDGSDRRQVRAHSGEDEQRPRSTHQGRGVRDLPHPQAEAIEGGSGQDGKPAREHEDPVAHKASPAHARHPALQRDGWSACRLPGPRAGSRSVLPQEVIHSSLYHRVELCFQLHTPSSSLVS